MISGGTVTLQSSRDSRGEKFLRACRINNKSKAITTLNQLYEENINVIHYHGAFMYAESILHRVLIQLLHWIGY